MKHKLLAYLIIEILMILSNQTNALLTSTISNLNYSKNNLEKCHFNLVHYDESCSTFKSTKKHSVYINEVKN